MAYNNYFPMGGYQPYQPYQPYQAQQITTPPTIRADIVQVGNRAEAMNFPVGAGQTQMMIAKDDSAIYIKSAFANGQANLEEYIKKPHEVEKPSQDYVTREEFERRIAELMQRKAVSNEQTVQFSEPRTGAESDSAVKG